MGEQERESPATTSGYSPAFHSHKEDQLGQVVPTAGIWAETIMATNVANVQNIGMQAIHVHHKPSQPRTPPLQRPRQSEYFADREREQAWLQDHLKLGRTVTVCGPGGIGKTALVAKVLWTLATGNTLPAAFPDGIFFHSFYQQSDAAIALEQIARTFGEEPLPTPAHAAQRALSGRNALLVFDGVEEATNLKQVLEVCGGCIVLMTSQRRSDAPGPEYRLDLRPLPGDEAVIVVQTWGKTRAANETITRQICEIVGNLPLALYLVGRYLEQREEEASEYLHWLQETPLVALDQGMSHQESVPVLLDRSIARLNVDSQRVLTVIGLLALAPFRRELIAKTLDLSDITIGQLLAELVNYGLVVRWDMLYEVSHRLIHTYAHEALSAKSGLISGRSLAEHIVRTLNELFPDVTYANWATCEELLPHVQTSATLIDEYALIFPETVRLLTMAGWYLKERARYTQAELLLKRALSIAENEQGIPLAHTGLILQNLAQLSQLQGLYDQAELLYQRALVIGEQIFGANHPNTAVACSNLAQLYRILGRYDQAEALLQRALFIVEKTLGPDNADTGSVLGNLAQLYMELGRYIQAQQLYQRALTHHEHTFGPDHPDTAITLHNLAQLYRIQGKYDEAETLLQRVLAINEQAFGPDHPDVAITLNNLAILHQGQGKYDEVEALLQRALVINELALGPDHPEVANTISNLAQLYEIQGRYNRVKPLLQRALVIKEKAFGRDHLQVAITLNNLALFYQSLGQYAQAESLLQHVLTIYERAFGHNHPEVGRTLNNLAQLYLEQNQYDKVEALCKSALHIYEQTLGPDHPESGRALHNLARLYNNQGQYTQAESLYKRALAISEPTFGPNHPNTAAVLNTLALLYKTQGQYAQAEPLLQRALAINEESLGPNHPNTAAALNNLAGFYKAQNQYAQAEPLYKRALIINKQALGSDHPNTVLTTENYFDLLQKKRKETSVSKTTHHRIKRKLAKRARKKNRRQR